MDISEFKRLHETSHYSRHPWEVARGRVLLRLLRKNLPLQPARLVDIGSGDAYVVNRVYQNKVAGEYFAIDTAYTPEIVTQLEENNHHSPIKYYQTLDDFQKAVPPVDKTLYLCMDVLEHLPDEGIVLDHIVTPKPGQEKTLYFFSVPAFQSVFSDHDVLLGHYRRYTVKQFRDLLTGKGLTVIDSGYFFFTLLTARWLERKFIRKKEASIDNWEGGKLKTALFTWILNVDFTLSAILKTLGIRLPGLSCYCICQR